MRVEESIKVRKSTRSFDKQAKLDFSKLESKLIEINSKVGPFGNKIKVDLVKSSEKSSEMKLGTYGMIKDAENYLVVSVKEAKHIALDVGYLFEEVILEATNLGFSTCWMAGTFSRAHFAKAINLQEEMIIPIVAPIGKEANKKSFIDKHIVSRKPKTRKAYETLFFDTNNNPLVLTDDVFRIGLEMVRLAPSGMNRQSWRVVEEGTNYHFYSTAKGDKSSVDIGIAIAHFDLYLKANGVEGQISIAPKDYMSGYVATWSKH